MSETTARVFNVLLDRKTSVNSALAALVKRAARRHLEGVLTWEWGKAFADVVRIPRDQGERDCPIPGGRLSHDSRDWIVNVTRVPLTLIGVTPRLNGWRFVATLQHLDGENIVRVLPEESIDASYRTRGPQCDHCRAPRRRNDTYVLRHDDGRSVQVGSTCLRDFLGSDDAAMIAAKAELLAFAASVAEGGEDGDGVGGGRGTCEMLLSEYLPIVAWCVREQGWTSRTAAREHDGMTATADAALDYLCDHKASATAGCAPSEEDIAMAASAEAWAEALTDAEVDAAKGDYLHNLRAVARTGLASIRTAGIAASAITAYQRHIGAMRARAERTERPNVHVGTVGEKVTFGLAAKVGKKGQPLKGAPVVLSAEPVTLDFMTGYETQYGYTTLLKFRSAEGALLVWKASGAILARGDVGKRYTLAGTVKEHGEYKGDRQTVLTRCAVTECAEDDEQIAA